MRIPVKKLVAFGAAAAFVLTAAGCSSSASDTKAGGDASGSDASSNAEINLLVPSYSDNTKAEWETIIKNFEAANAGIKVNLEVQSWENINQVVTTKIQNKQAPDILNIDSFTAYASDDLLYEAKDIVSPDTLNAFPENFRTNASTGGVQYGLPLIASARALFYNKDLFEKAGVTAPPKTWDELLDTAKKIKAAVPDASGYGMPLGNEEAQAETAVFVFGNNSDYGNAEAVKVNTEKNVEAVKFMQKMIEEKATQADPGASQRTPLGNIFFQGKIGMVVGLPAYINMIKEKNPKLNYGIAPIPSHDGSEFTLGVADHLMAFKNDDTKKEAITKFLDYFFSDAVYAPEFAGPEGFIPTTTGGMAALKDSETIKDFIPLLEKAKFYPFQNPNWQNTQAAIQSNIGKIADPKTDVKALLDEIQAAGEQS